jgi:hypothetical protein
VASCRLAQSTVAALVTHLVGPGADMGMSEVLHKANTTPGEWTAKAHAVQLERLSYENDTRMIGVGRETFLDTDGGMHMRSLAQVSLLGTYIRTMMRTCVPYGVRWSCTHNAAALWNPNLRGNPGDLYTLEQNYCMGRTNSHLCGRQGALLI